MWFWGLLLIKLKSCKISFVNNINFSCLVVLTFYAEHTSSTALYCATFRNKENCLDDSLFFIFWWKGEGCLLTTSWKTVSKGFNENSRTGRKWYKEQPIKFLMCCGSLSGSGLFFLFLITFGVKLAWLFHAWLDCFTLLKLSISGYLHSLLGSWVLIV